MMKAKLSHLALFLTVSILSTAPLFARAPDTLWTRTYGGSGIDIAYGVVPTPDGGFVVGGYTPHDSGAPPDMWMFKTDAKGTMLWEYKHGSHDRSEAAFSLEPALDGGFVLAGEAVNTFGYTDAYIVKTDENGGGEWGFVFGDPLEYTYAYCVVAAHDSGFLAAGHQTISLAGCNVYMIKTFPNGGYYWHNFFDWGWSERALGIARTDDYGYVITGETNSFGEHSYGMFLQKFNYAGYEEWFSLYSWAGDQHGRSVQQTLDGGYIIAGYRKESGTPDHDVVVIRTDSLGHELWRKIYGTVHHDKAYHVQVLPDSGYIVTGYSRESHSFDVWVLRLDANGDTLWTKFIGDEWLGENSFQIRQTADGGYIIAGGRTIESYNIDAYLIRLAPDPEGIENNRDSRIPERFALYQNYPNPFYARTTIEYAIPKETDVAIKIYSVTGQAVRTIELGSQKPGFYKAVWDGRDERGQRVAPGVYFCRMQAGKYVATKKLTVLR